MQHTSSLKWPCLGRGAGRWLFLFWLQLRRWGLSLDSDLITSQRDECVLLLLCELSLRLQWSIVSCSRLIWQCKSHWWRGRNSMASFRLDRLQSCSMLSCKAVVSDIWLPKSTSHIILLTAQADLQLQAWLGQEARIPSGNRSCRANLPHGADAWLVALPA